MKASWMRRLAWTWRGAGWRGPAVLAALLVAAAALVEATWTHPARRQLAELQAQMAVAGPAASVEVPAPRRALGAFYGQFGDMASLPQQLARLHQVAQAHGVSLDQGQYRLERESDSRLLQYQIVLPVSGSYVKLRRFIAAAKEAMPGVALDHVSFERKRADEQSIDAELRFVLYLLDDAQKP